jgi:two-component system, chemotaxis family, protein-glutamate methylesterase/glutaminase
MQDPQLKRVVVVGASAGGIDALRSLVAALPPDFPAALCIVLHTSPQSPGVLESILGRVSTLPTALARTGAPLRPGHIYVPPPDHHLLVEPGALRLTRGPRENRFRPAIDPLFRSAAQVYGPAAVGVILTGNLDDGAAGLWTIAQLGGTTIVQDPDDAEFPSMPQSALGFVAPDHCVPLSGIAPLLARIAATPPHESGAIAMPDHIDVELRIAREEHPMDAGIEQLGEPSAYACPECHGVLLQLEQEHRLRFRCHTGHAYSVESLVASAQEGIEEALWSAIRSLEEGSLLMRHLSKHLEAAGQHETARQHDARAAAMRTQAASLRSVAKERKGFDPSLAASDRRAGSDPAQERADAE